MLLEDRPTPPGKRLDQLNFYAGSRELDAYLALLREPRGEVSAFDRLVYDFKNHHPRRMALGRRLVINRLFLALRGVLAADGRQAGTERVSSPGLPTRTSDSLKLHFPRLHPRHACTISRSFTTGRSSLLMTVWNRENPHWRSMFKRHASLGEKKFVSSPPNSAPR